MPPTVLTQLAPARRLLSTLVALLLVLTTVVGMGSQAAIAATDQPDHPDQTAGPDWIEVARSSEGVQYVAPGSIEVTEAGVRLKSYWQPAPSKGLYQPVYYVTEYDCQGNYRDIEVTNRRETPSWTAIGADKLNRGAMAYGCARQQGGK